MSELRLEGVSVRYGTGRRALVAVDGVDLVVPSGKVVGLVGESGSGKSTLARAICGLLPAHAGRVLLDGSPVPNRARRGEPRPLQMVFQDPYSSLDPRLTVGASVAEAIPRGAVPRAKRRDEVGRLLELVGLDAADQDVLPGEMSGGQRQRVALARALAGRPEVIVADEITSALDVSIQGAVLNVLRELQSTMRMSMLFISHNLAVVRYVSDMIAVMYLGRVVEFGPTREVLADPQHPYTRDLLAAAPRRDALSLDDGAPAPPPEVADAEPPDPHRPPPGCRYHTRCPVGPRVLADRDVCRTADPAESRERRRHDVACHFAAERAPAPEPAT